MATPRKSAVQVAAREKARAKAHELTVRHEKLLDLATHYFEQQEVAEQFRADARAKAELVLAKAESDAEEAILDAARTASLMVVSGESKSAVTARLGISTAELKRMLELAGADGNGTPEETHEVSPNENLVDSNH